MSVGKTIAALVAAAVLGAAGWWVWRGNPVTVSTAPARTGKISSFFEERAMTALPRIYKITMPFDGRVKAIPYLPGTELKEGQVAAELVTFDLETEKARSLANLEALKAKIKVSQYLEMEKTLLKESADWIISYNQSLAASEKLVEAAKVKMDFAKWVEESYKKMREGNAVSEKDYNKTLTDAADAAMQYQSMDLLQKAMTTLGTPVRLLPVYARQMIEEKELNTVVLNREQAGAEAALVKTGRDLERAVIKSPVNGVVLKRYVQNEGFLTAGSPLLDIGDLNTLEISADILSQDASRVKPGNTVEIFGPSTGPAPLTGTVSRVFPEGFTKTSSLGVEEQRVTVKIAFDKEPLERFKKDGGSLGIGYRVQVRIFTAAAENALIAPRSALFRDNSGSWAFYAVENGRASLRKAAVGLINDREAQILKGAAENDMIILAPPVSLKDGDLVSSHEPQF